MIDTDYLLGRRFSFTGGEGPDVTVVAIDPQAGVADLHALDKSRHRIPLATLIEAVETGALEETAYGCPFVWDLTTSARRVTPFTLHGRTFSREVTS